MRNFILTCFLLCCSIITFAAINKDATNAVVTITTTDATNRVLGTSIGFAVSMTNDNGVKTTQILSSYKYFKHAVKGDVTLADNNKTIVHRITGANELYDVVRFTMQATTPYQLNIAASKLNKGNKAYIVTANKAQIKEVNILEASEFSGLAYYTLSVAPDTTLIGCPLVNEQGEVVGVVQRSAKGTDANAFAIGIEFNEALGINTMSAADVSLNNISIPKQLPADQNFARSYLYLLPNNTEDTLSYLGSLTDFIEAYPSSPVGYTERAKYFISTNQYAKAEADYDAALQNVTDKADVHYNRSVAIYNLNRLKSYNQYKDWDLGYSLSEINNAYAIDAAPRYLEQRGRILYAMKRYTEAYDTYNQVNQTKNRSSENLYYQARSLEMAGGDSMQVLALLDSAIVRFIRPLRPDAAPYLLYRAERLARSGQYNKAYIDYMDYEEVVGKKNLPDGFFFVKEQTAYKAKFFPQALADIEQAIAINAKEYIYFIEKSLIEIHLQQYEDASYSAGLAIKLNDKLPDAYKLQGIALAELGKTVEARKSLQRAAELGDDNAKEWLNSMKK